jgi:hypothetical protein
MTELRETVYTIALELGPSLWLLLFLVYLDRQ